MFFILCLSYGLAVLLFLRAHGVHLTFSSEDVSISLVSLPTVLLFGILFSGITSFKKASRECGSSLHYWKTDLLKQLTFNTVAKVVFLFVSQAIVIYFYDFLKQYSPIFNSMYFDSQFHTADRLIHFGVNPYPSWFFILPGGIFHSAMDKLYIIWFLIKFPVYAYFLFSSNVRFDRFFSAFFLMFMLCGTIAGIVPSLGPCYKQPVQQIQQAYPIAHSTQVLLWMGYMRFKKNPSDYVRNSYGGIAAFPSLHVGIAFLVFFFFLKSRKLNVLLGLYAFLILWTSVTTGWHYAVDGYFSIMLAFCLKLLMGKVIQEPADKALSQGNDDGVE
jgi:hypothetical protein